jgi:hypothetical protein
MSATIEFYRVALEREIKRWDGFARALRREDREAFEELMNEGRSYASEGSNAEQTIVFEPMAMSIILAHDKRIRQLEETLAAIKPPEDVSLEEENPVEPIAIQQNPTPKKVQRGLGDFG